MKLFSTLFIVSFSMAQSYTWQSFKVNFDHFTSRVDSSTMFVNGKAVGSWIWGLKKEAEKFYLKDKSVLFNSIDETMDFVMNLAGQGEDKLALTLNTARTNLAADLNFKMDRVSGKYYVNEKEMSIDSTHKGIEARVGALALLPFLELDDKTHELSLFLASSGTIYNATLKAYKNETLVIGKMKYSSVTRIELFPKEKNKGIVNTIYLSNDKPKRILQVDVPSQNMTIQFTKELNRNNLFD